MRPCGSRFWSILARSFGDFELEFGFMIMVMFVPSGFGGWLRRSLEGGVLFARIGSVGHIWCVNYVMFVLIFVLMSTSSG